MRDSMTTPAALRCDAPDCREEAAIRHAGEQLCYAHALARGNRERAAAGLPPVIFEEGRAHVCQ